MRSNMYFLAGGHLVELYGKAPEKCQDDSKTSMKITTRTNIEALRTVFPCPHCIKVFFRALDSAILVKGPPLSVCCLMCLFKSMSTIKCLLRGLC